MSALYISLTLLFCNAELQNKRPKTFIILKMNFYLNPGMSLLKVECTSCRQDV